MSDPLEVSADLTGEHVISAKRPWFNPVNDVDVSLTSLALWLETELTFATPAEVSSAISAHNDDTGAHGQTTTDRAMLTAADDSAQRTLLSVETTAQLNARDTANRNRANHTGTQAQSTVVNLVTDLAA